MKKYLLILKHSPYQSSLAAEGLELALALSAFNQTVSLLFIEQSVLQLLPQQQPDHMFYKDFTKAYTGLSLFDINNVYISQASVQQYNIADLIIKPQIIDDLNIASLINSHDIVLTL
jgi:sulfur relay protein TusC/DsrF